MKKCAKCKKIKPFNCFYSSKTQSGGYQAYCRQCNLKYLLKKYPTLDVNKRRAKSRQYMIKGKYGLTPEEYLKMLKKQKGVCAICKKPETTKSNPKGNVDHLRVDHNHITGRVRGLLCSECNFGISKFNDSLKLLSSAYIYIMKDKIIIYNETKNEHSK